MTLIPPGPHSLETSQPIQVVLIHVGKCGGSTLREALEHSPTQVDSITHIRQPPLGAQYRYYITLRCPISRATSAFYWRRKLVITDSSQEHRFPGEAQILRHYGSLDTLARALYHSDGSDNPLPQGHFRSIHHLSEGIAFYLQDLLAGVQPEQILGVLRQETLEQDILRHFDYQSTGRVNDNRQNTSPADRHLSPEGTANLRRFLQADFDCAKQLYDWGKIPSAYASPS